MDTSQIAFTLASAILVFWMVGAYNRLVGLRGDVVRRFAPIDTESAQRHDMLERWLGAVAELGTVDDRMLHAVRAAEGQAQAALAAMRRKPTAPQPPATLRLAEQTLAEARARVERLLPPFDELDQPVTGDEAPTLFDLAGELDVIDAALAAACRQFNEASAVYNAARRQFPTWVAASLFGFKVSGTL